jgi:hypothetical protein
MTEPRCPDLDFDQLQRAEELLHDIANTVWRNYSYSDAPSVADFILKRHELTPEILMRYNTCEDVGRSLHVQRMIKNNEELRDMGKEYWRSFRRANDSLRNCRQAGSSDTILQSRIKNSSSYCCPS